MKNEKNTDLRDKWVLLTGAAGGIGQALAIELAENHASLVLTSRNKQKLVQMQKELCNEYGIEVIPVALDLTVPGACRKLYELLERQGIVLDILINNAGTGDHSAFVQADWNRLQNIINLNITALTELSWLFGRLFQQRKHGTIVNIASVASYTPGPYLAVYYASKAYVLSLSMALEQELKADHVNICVVCPQRTASNFDKQAHMHRKENLQNVQSADPQVLARKIVRAIKKQQSLIIDGPLTAATAIGSHLLTTRQMAKIMKNLNQITEE